MFGGTICLEGQILQFKSHTVNTVHLVVSNTDDGSEKEGIVDNKTFAEMVFLAMHPEHLDVAYADRDNLEDKLKLNGLNFQSLLV